jgi:hypothetical protein
VEDGFRHDAGLDAACPVSRGRFFFDRGDFLREPFAPFRVFSLQWGDCFRIRRAISEKFGRFFRKVPSRSTNTFVYNIFEAKCLDGT